jgi:hypothetical protein
LNREVRSLAKIGSWEVDLVNESVFWSDEVHQLHDTDVKSFIPALEGAMNFIGQIFANGKGQYCCMYFDRTTMRF